MPFVLSLLSHLVLHTEINYFIFIGAVIIIAGVMLVSVARYREGKSEQVKTRLVEEDEHHAIELVEEQDQPHLEEGEETITISAKEQHYEEKGGEKEKQSDVSKK